MEPTSSPKNVDDRYAYSIKSEKTNHQKACLSFRSIKDLRDLRTRYNKPDRNLDGALSFELLQSQRTYKIGQDQLFNFGKIKLENGSFLKVSPNDYFLRFLVFKDKSKYPKDSNEYKHRNPIADVVLPSCLFKQAIKGDQICFSHEGRNFDFKLRDFIFADDTSIPFNERLQYFDKQSHRVYAYTKDMPKDYRLWCTMEHNAIDINNPIIALTPQAERLQIDKPGCIPLNREELKLISQHADKLPMVSLEKEDHVLLILEMPGDPTMDFVIDCDQLYIHSYEKNWNDSFGSISLKFSKPIDKNAISLIQREHGIMTFKLPYKDIGEEYDVLNEKLNDEELKNIVDEQAIPKENDDNANLNDEPSNDRCCNNGCITM